MPSRLVVGVRYAPAPAVTAYYLRYGNYEDLFICLSLDVTPAKCYTFYRFRTLAKYWNGGTLTWTARSDVGKSLNRVPA